jgi:hypothetical protein
MAYFIVPVQFSRKRALSPADKAEYALTVNYYQSHCGPPRNRGARQSLRPRERGGHLGRLRCHVATSWSGDWLADLVPLHGRALAQAPLMDIRTIFCRRRHQPSRPPLANSTPGSPAPAMGPGTTAGAKLVSLILAPAAARATIERPLSRLLGRRRMGVGF